MNATELKSALAQAHYPKTFAVDAAAYLAAQDALIDQHKVGFARNELQVFLLAHGPHGGLLFKGVELLLYVPEDH